VSDVVNAEKCFSTLANLITTKVPQSRLAVLLGDRYICCLLEMIAIGRIHSHSLQFPCTYFPFLPIPSLNFYSQPYGIPIGLFPFPFPNTHSKTHTHPFNSPLFGTTWVRKVSIPRLESYSHSHGIPIPIGKPITMVICTGH